MRFLHWILFLAVFSASFAATAPKKTGTVRKTTGSGSGKASTARTTGKSSGKAVANRKGGRGAARGKAGPVRAARQQTPTRERYKEIQQALTDKGYLKTEPNGVWDAQSAEALRQYQADNNLSPTGKLSAASLIHLGLGPKPAGEAPKPPAAPAPEQPTSVARP